MWVVYMMDKVFEQVVGGSLLIDYYETLNTGV